MRGNLNEITTNNALLKFITSLLHSNFVKKIKGVFFFIIIWLTTLDDDVFMGFEFEFFGHYINMIA